MIAKLDKRTVGGGLRKFSLRKKRKTGGRYVGTLFKKKQTRGRDLVGEKGVSDWLEGESNGDKGTFINSNT